jgi:hypothetical protein
MTGHSVVGGSGCVVTDGVGCSGTWSVGVGVLCKQLVGLLRALVLVPEGKTLLVVHSNGQGNMPAWLPSLLTE